MPAYNAAKFLPRAIESVITQTFPDWRILLIDDGSTDNIAEVIAPYIARLGEKLLYIRQENQGVSAARNTAIRASSGEFIAFLDADDMWMPDRLSEAVAIFRERPEIGLVYSGITYIDVEDRPGATFVGGSKHAARKIATALYTRQIHATCVAVTIRRSCLEGLDLFDVNLRATEDRDLWLRIAQRCDSAYIPKPLALYRVSANSITSDPELLLRTQVKFVHKNYGSPGCGFRQRQIALANTYLEHSGMYQARGQSGKALRLYLKAVSSNPAVLVRLKLPASIAFSWLRTAFRR